MVIIKELVQYILSIIELSMYDSIAMLTTSYLLTLDLVVKIFIFTTCLACVVFVISSNKAIKTHGFRIHNLSKAVRRSGAEMKDNFASNFPLIMEGVLPIKLL
jgi:hypothetical protein